MILCWFKIAFIIVINIITIMIINGDQPGDDTLELYHGFSVCPRVPAGEDSSLYTMLICYRQHRQHHEHRQHRQHCQHRQHHEHCEHRWYQCHYEHHHCNIFHPDLILIQCTLTLWWRKTFLIWFSHIRRCPLMLWSGNLAEYLGAGRPSERLSNREDSPGQHHHTCTLDVTHVTHVLH